ncbi:MAG: ATP-binding protein [Cytophagales bacterium]|nr:MAG: ATP-binding protein [Cytophagales bacterium]
MKSFKIKIPSIVENIRMVESFIDNAREKFSIDDDIYGNIMIAITEAVNNAIKHGNKEEKGKNVQLSVIFNDKSLRFLIEDEGKGFDYKNLADPTAPANINKPGGRGIFLIKHLSDEVNFSKNGSLVEIVFYM